MNPLIEHEAATLAVSQMFTQAKTDLTELEANLWVAEIERLGTKALITFAKFWISGESGLSRAPRIQDFRRYSDPANLNEDIALDLLYRTVGERGPYVDPGFTDSRLDAAVMALGGWATVCQELPLMTDDFKYKRYKERFSTAWGNAQAKQIQGLLQNFPKTLGLCSLPTQAIPLSPIAQLNYEGDAP